MSKDMTIESCQIIYSKGKHQNKECMISLFSDNRVTIFYKKDQMFGRAVAQGIGGIFAREVYSAITDHGMTYLENFNVTDIDNIKRSPNPSFDNGWRFYLKDGNSFDITLEPDFLNALSKAILEVKTPKKEKTPKKRVSSTSSSTLVEPEFNISHLTPSLRRAFILIEDSEWAKADTYLENILDSEPENAYAYLGKLLVEKRLSSPGQLSDSFAEIKDNKYFKRTFTYADADLKEYLSWIIRANDASDTASNYEIKSRAANASFTKGNTSNTNTSTKTDSYTYKYSDYYEFTDYEAPKYNEPKTTQSSAPKHNTSKHVNKTHNKRKRKLLFPVLFIIILLIAVYFGKLQIGYILLDHGNTKIASKLILFDDFSGTKFLKGNWVATSGERFSVGADGHLIDGLPCVYTGNYMWEIRNSIVRDYTKADPTRKNDKKIEILSRDIISIYCYANHYTYILERQNDENLYKNNLSFTLTFDKQGGYGGTDSVIVNINDKFPSGLLPPKKDGYEFTGYYSSESTTALRYYDENMESKDTWSYPGDRTLYAHWLKIKDPEETYTITFIKNGGVGVPDSIEVKYNEKLPSGLAPPTRPGYAFKGYFSTSTSGIKYYDENMTPLVVWNHQYGAHFYAQWIKLDLNQDDITDSNNHEIYTITLNKPGAEGGTNHVSTEYGKLLPESALAPNREGFVFKGYFALPNKYSEQYYDANMKPLKPWMQHNDGELYAIWEKDNTQEVILTNGKITTGNSNRKDTSLVTYYDSLSGITFSLPAGWEERPLNKERDIVKAKFISSDLTGIAFGSYDLYAQYPNKIDVSRSDLNLQIMSYSDAEDVAKRLASGSYSIDRSTYNQKEYYILSFEALAPITDVSWSHCVYAFTINNGYMITFQYYGPESSLRYTEFINLLKTINY